RISSHNFSQTIVREEDVANRQTPLSAPLSRRELLKQSAVATSLGGLSLAGLSSFFCIPEAFGAEHPAIGTFPAGSSGDTVNVGAAVPRTGTYAVQGEDELKGWQLAVEHINNGD